MAAKMPMCRRPRSHLDLVHPDTAQRAEQHQQKQIANLCDGKTVRAF